MLAWVIVAVMPVALLVGVFVASNGQSRQRKRTSGVLSDTAEYKARHELIPKLEETLNGYSFRPPVTPEAVTGRVPVLPAPLTLLAQDIGRSRAEHPAGKAAGDTGMFDQDAFGAIWPSEARTTAR
jgi:hypothetical protein